MVVSTAQQNYNNACAAYALDAVRNTVYCYTTTAPLTCGHGDSCTDACCSLTVHTHDPAEGGCYEYTWTLKADVNNNEIADESETYTVVYVDGLGNELSRTGDLAYGADTPTIADPTRTGYTFAGWSPKVENKVETPTETGSTTITYTAAWDANEHTITWNAGDGKFADGTKEKTTNADYDSTPVAPEVPTKAGDAQYTWTFAGWKSSLDGKTYTELPTVTGDTTYTATYTNTVNKYTVKFVNEDGTPLSEEKYAYGTAAGDIAVPADPTKTATAQYTYTFAGWDKEIASVTGDATYTATYTSTLNEYTVKFVDTDGTTVLYEQTLKYGETPVYEGKTTKTTEDGVVTHNLTGWDKTIASVTGEATYTAIWTEVGKVSVTFDVEGSKTAVQVYPGETVTAPTDPVKEGYEFLGWYNGETEFDFAAKVEENTTLTAKFAEYVATNTTTGKSYSNLAEALTESVEGNTVVLLKDIDMEWAEWACVNFNGNLDGDGHTIRNITYVPTSTGRVSFIQKLTGSAKNLTLDGIKANVPTNGRFGGFVRYLNGDVENVHVKNVEITATSADVGGFAAYHNAGKVTNCSVTNFTVSGTTSVNQTLIGGFVANSYYGHTYTNCDVTGFKVNIASAEVWTQIGGFTAQTSSGWDVTTLTDCDVTGIDITASGYAYVGGLVANPGAHTIITNCTTKGKIDATALLGGAAGGILGDAGWNDNLGDKGGHVLTGCSADVDITTKVVAAGGFIGSCTNSNGKAMPITVTNCSASGDITCVEGGTAPVGGFAGEADRGTFTGCSASGTVTGTTYAGGFIGHAIAGHAITVMKCTGTSAVTGTEGQTAGIVGYIDEDATVTLGKNSYTVEPEYNPINADYVTVYVAQVGETLYATLAEAVAAANAVEGGATVELLKDVTLGEKLTVSGNVTISGEHTITRADDYTGTLFTVDAGATLTLDGGLTIDGGNNYSFNSEAYAADRESFVKIASADAGKWFTPEEGAPVATDFMITTKGTVNLNNITIQNNYSTNSGVVQTSGTNVTVNLNGAKITHIASTKGNGVAVQSSGAGNVINMYEGTVIDGNHVGGNHGIFKVYSGTTLNMYGGEIKNTTGWNSNGVAVGVYWGTFNMYGGKICSNSSVNGPNNGRCAAVYLHSGHSFTMTGGSICHNRGGSRGGLDAPYSNGTAVITGGYIGENSSYYVEQGYGSYYPADVNGTAGMAISGGTFTQDVDQWCADGFKAVETAPGVWGIADAAKVICFSPVTDGTLAPIYGYENRDAAQEYTDATGQHTDVLDWKIELLADVTMESALTIASGYNTTIAAGTYKLLGEITVAEGASLTIYSGTFNDEDAKQYVADGYRPVDNGDGTWTVYTDDYRFITIQTVGEGSVTVNGQAAAEKYFTNEALTIVAAPTVSGGISKTYVSSIAVNGVEQALTYGDDYEVTISAPVVDAEIVITFADAKFELTDDNTMTFYPGIQTPTYEGLYTTVIASPAYDAQSVTSVKYLARVAGTQELDLSELGAALADLDGLAGIGLRAAYDALVGDDGLYELQLGDLWLDVGTPIPQVDIKAVTDAEIEKIKAMIAAGNTSSAISAMGNLVTVLTEEAYYLGAHDFGYNPEQTAYVEETLHVVYETDAMKLEDKTIVIKLTDDRTNTVITGSNVEFEYKEYTEDSLMAAIGAVLTDDSGNPVAGTVYKVQSTVNKPVGEYTITLKFDGNETHKPAEATVTLTVIKAPSSIDVPNVNITYGDAYDATPVVTNKHGEVINVDTIRFVVGLDIAELDVNGDGITGLTGKVQLLVPDDLQTILSLIGMEEGATVTLSELVAFLNENAATLESFGLTQEMVDSLNAALEAISEVAETGDLEITLGGSYPTNTGAYLQGAVTANANYETALDAGYIIIKPDATQVYLDWNYTDSNGIFSRELLKHIDLGASAYDDAAFAAKNAEATALVHNLFFGIDGNGELVTSLDGTELANGAYMQLAFIAEFGNAFYYAEPIARPVVIVPSVENVELVDALGNALDAYTYTYDKTAKELYATVDGQLMELDITYTGIRTNTEVYGPTTKAPVHAGAYTALVTYITRNASGEITGVGMDVAVITIEPAQSDISVTGGAVAYDGQAHTVTVEAPTSDVTLISGTVKLNGNVNEIGLDALEGNVNVDFPAWLDKHLSAQFADAYANGVSAKDFVYKLNQYSDKLVELGVSAEQLADVIAVLEQIPETVTVTFTDAVTYSEIGAYFYYGIVTDSDYLPSADTGLLVIQKQDLEFALNDTTVTWNGEEQFADVTNPLNSDYVSIVIDRENNTANIILEDDLNAVVAILENTLGRELPETMDVAELLSVINRALDRLDEVEELPVYAENVLSQIKAAVAELPQTGTVTLNGANPTEIGTYECYAITFSAEYATVVSSAVLEIVPVQVEVTVEDATKYYGEEDPAFKYTVKYLDHEGNEITGLTTDVTVTFTRDAGQDVGEYKVTTASVTIADEHYQYAKTVDGKLTILPKQITEADVTLDGELVYNAAEQTQGITVTDGVTYEVTGNTGTNAGSYTLTVAGTGNYTGSVDVEWSIAQAKVTVTVSDITITVDDAIPTLTDYVTAECTEGTVPADELALTITTDAVAGKHGEYTVTASWAETSGNYTVTYNGDGKLTITIGDYICWNVHDGVYFKDLSDALAIADAGETIQMLAAQTSEDMILVKAGTTLDLNGSYVTAGNALSFGQIEDTAETVGGMKIAYNTAAAFTMLQKSNAYMPLYDVDDGCYRFFAYSFHYFASRTGTDMITYAYTIRFENADAYALLAAFGSNTGLNVTHYLHWTDLGENEAEFNYTSEIIKKFGTNALTVIENGSGTAVLTFKVSGLSAISGQTLNSRMTVFSVTNVAQEDMAPSYDIP